MSSRFLFSFSALLLFSCAGEKNTDEKKAEEKPFQQEVILIDDSRPELDAFAVSVLEKMKICSAIDTVITLPPCEADYFRLFQYQHGRGFKSGFIVEMIPGMFGTPVHQLVIIKEMEGQFGIVNQYLGRLIEMRTTETGFNDLLIGYLDPDVGLVTIRHEWQGQKYDPVDVEEINNHFVKPEMKDSVNAIFLSAFSAGY